MWDLPGLGTEPISFIDRRVSYHRATSKAHENHFSWMPTMYGSSMAKNPPANVGDEDSIPGSGRSPGGENGNLLQYSRLDNPMDRRAWPAAVHGVTWTAAYSWTQLSELNNNHCVPDNRTGTVFKRAVEPHAPATELLHPSQWHVILS